MHTFTWGKLFILELCSLFDRMIEKIRINKPSVIHMYTKTHLFAGVNFLTIFTADVNSPEPILMRPLCCMKIVSQVRFPCMMSQECK